MTHFDTCRWLLYPERYKLLRLPRDKEHVARPHVELEQFVATTYSPEGITTICVETTHVPESSVISDGWRVLQIKGPYEEANIKLVTEIARILRGANIEIHHPSAFDTDYLMLKHEQVMDALDVLEKADYQIDQRQSAGA